MSSTRKSIIFLGSKPIGYQCLQYLLSLKDSLNIQITAVLTQTRKEFDRGADLASLAVGEGIPVINSLDGLPDCDILYSVQYHQILKQEHINKARQIALNLHMAPLPEYRGSNQFSFAILEERKEFGTTIHRIDTRIDHGDILFEKRFPIPDECWIKELYDLTEEASLALFKETLPNIIAGDYKLTPQQSLEPMRGCALHYRSEMAEIKQIELSWDKERIDRHIRASSMPGFEPPYTIVGGRRVYFTTSPE